MEQVVSSQPHALPELGELSAACPVGKRLPGALYVHRSALTALSPELREYEQLARRCLESKDEFTLVKFQTTAPKISYLLYPDFEDDPHPALAQSIQVNLETGQVRYSDYRRRANPPILHRKETFLHPDHPNYLQFAHLTQTEAALGLLDSPREIGLQDAWRRRLESQKIELAGQVLACPLVQENRLQIQRHRAALPRKTLSRPLRLALEAGLLPEGGSFFDYGCGQGQDQREIAQRGYPSAGWDPHYAPSAPRVEADLVNLGYVLNVIEDPQERREALLDAWRLTRQVLVVSAQVVLEDEKAGWLPYGDGVVTRRQTFQKYYEQLELKSYIEQTLGTEAWALALGVYVVFRSPEQAQTFQLSRQRQRATTPRPGRSLRRFEDYEPLLRPLMAFYGERGRLPQRGELPEEAEILCVFSNYRRAFALILQATPAGEWDAIQDQRRQELLLYLALSRFEERPRPRQLPPALRWDLKELLGGYEAACLLADGLLYGLRDLSQLAALSQTSPLGKCFKQSFLIHVNYLDQLPLLLRLYEGCASQTAGRLEGANVVKLSFREPRVSYLVYPHFDALAHPPLTERLDVAVNRLRVSYRDYRGAENPPILHEKDRLVGADYGSYAQFARLSRQEWERGLLDDYGPIRRREGWERRLTERCCQVRGHRLCWRSDGDPLKLKYLKAEAQRRRRDDSAQNAKL